MWLKWNNFGLTSRLQKQCANGHFVCDERFWLFFPNFNFWIWINAIMICFFKPFHWNIKSLRKKKDNLIINLRRLSIWIYTTLPGLFNVNRGNRSSKAIHWNSLQRTITIGTYKMFRCLKKRYILYISHLLRKWI